MARPGRKVTLGNGNGANADNAQPPNGAAPQPPDNTMNETHNPADHPDPTIIPDTAHLTGAHDAGLTAGSEPPPDDEPDEDLRVNRQSSIQDKRKAYIR